MEELRRRVLGTSARRALLAGSVLAGCLLWTPGCDEDCVTDSCPDPVPGGTIRGHVDVGPMAFGGYARIERAIRTSGTDYTIFSPIDADGSFTAQVPYGSYFVSLGLTNPGSTSSSADASYWYGSNRWSLLTGERDTLVLDEGQPIRELDFVAGSLEVVVHASGELEGQKLALLPEHTSLPQPPYAYIHWEYVTAQVVDGTARFEMPGFLPGACRLQLSIGGNSYVFPGTERFYLPGTRSREDADTLIIETGQITHYEMDLTSASAVLRGTVRGSWQTFELLSPTVTLFSLDSLVVADRACAWDGYFSLRLYRPEPVKLRVVINGVSRWIGGGHFEDAEVFSPQHGGVVEVPELVESGLLVRLDLPEHTEGSTLRLVLYDATTLGRVCATGTGSGNGAALLCANLLPGTYRVFIDNVYLRTDAVSQWFDHAADLQSATVVTVPPEGQVAEIRAAMEAGGGIRGQLQGPSSYYCSAVFYIVDAQTAVCVGRTGCLPCDCLCICENPHPFCARGLADGDYKVGAVADRDTYSENPPPGTVWYPGTTDWNAAEVVRVENAATVEGIDITWPE